MAKKLRELRADLTTLIDAAKTASDAIDAAPDDAARAQAQTAWEAAKAAADRKRQECDRKTAMEELERTLPAVPRDDAGDGQGPRIAGGGPNFIRDPNKGFETPRQFLSAVMDVFTVHHGRCEDERLRYLATAGSDEQGTYSDPYGGFLVPVGFSPNLLQIVTDEDPISGRTTMLPMTTPILKIPARTDKDHTTSVTGGLRFYRRAETQSVTATRMAFEQVQLTAEPLMGIAYATEEIITDSAISFVALLDAGFRQELPAKLLDERINGTGAGTFEGIINAPCLVTVDAESGQEADTIVYENIVNMRAQCWRYQNAIWLYNQDALPQLAQLVIPIGLGGQVMWQASARDGEPDRIWGRPAFPSEFCPTLGDKGDLIVANFSQCLEAWYQQLQSAESIHVRFENHERAFKFFCRNDSRWWWRSALTPKKSSKTLSPIVTLAARA
jgi:HK97 family phage major capsid protein